MRNFETNLGAIMEVRIDSALLKRAQAAADQLIASGEAEAFVPMGQADSKAGYRLSRSAEGLTVLSTFEHKGYTFYLGPKT